MKISVKMAKKKKKNFRKHKVNKSIKFHICALVGLPLQLWQNCNKKDPPVIWSAGNNSGEV